jgi:uncharacterized protein (DUF2062 family)
MNPFTIPFFCVAQYSLGKFLVGHNLPPIVLTDYSIYTIMNTSWCIGYPLLVGGFLMAPFFAISAYFITYRAVIAIREKHKK